MERGWSAEVGIPAFNVRLESGTVLASVMKYGSADPYLHGTSLDKGLMLALPNSEGLLPEEAKVGEGADGSTSITDTGNAGGEDGGAAISPSTACTSGWRRVSPCASLWARGRTITSH